MFREEMIKQSGQNNPGSSRRVRARDLSLQAKEAPGCGQPEGDRRAQARRAWEEAVRGADHPLFPHQAGPSRTRVSPLLPSLREGRATEMPWSPKTRQESCVLILHRVSGQNNSVHVPLALRPGQFCSSQILLPVHNDSGVLSPGLSNDPEVSAARASPLLLPMIDIRSHQQRDAVRAPLA